MKKLLATTLLFLFVSSTLYAGHALDQNVKKQCQYIVYGNGLDDTDIDMYMLGMVEGQLFYISEEYESSFLLKANFSQIQERSCKEALNNNSSDGFMGKYMEGIYITTNKNAAHLSTLK